jgi:hypothetical protein
MKNNPLKLTGKISDPDSDETFIVSVSPAVRMDQIFSRFLAQHTPFGFESSVEDIAYHPLPYKPGSDDDLLLDKPWRLRLELYAKDKRMYMGLDLYSDVILGRGPSQPGRIILDLEPYGALEQGVSREHVMLRPTKTRLFAIDRGSTNSTSVNGVHSGPGVATRLNDEDLLTLGNMIIMVHIIDRPDGAGGDLQKPKHMTEANVKKPTPPLNAKKSPVSKSVIRAKGSGAVRNPRITSNVKGNDKKGEAVAKKSDTKSDG